MGSEGVVKVVVEAVKEPAAGERMITLTSLEGKEFRVSEAEARLSPYLARVIGNGVNVVALVNIPTAALETVTKYCNKHAAAALANPSAAASSRFNAAPPHGNPELDRWDRELVGGLDVEDALYHVLMAAHFLGIEGLIDAASEKAANEIKACETPKKIREKFGIPDDLTAQEKEEILREYAWAFGADDI